MAADKLVIVESPTKARTIGRMLGKDYKIIASMGHVRDLPKSSIGVDVENDFKPKYQQSRERSKLIKELKDAAKKAKQIYLAPDPDREGEAIAWHLEELLKKSTNGDFFRVTFHEITKSAIEHAFADTTDINMNLVESQQARRILDRLVGFKVSPLLWSKIQRNISAGRVQSVALRIVCEREREIMAFEPKEYWNFMADLAKMPNPNNIAPFTTKLHKINNKKFEINNETDATSVLNAVKSGYGFTVSKIERKPRQRRAQPPFITSTLQQAASSNLGFSASNTMRLAQQLYEGIDTGSGPVGLITYMRTDSVNLAAEAINNCRDYIQNNIGADYLPVKPNYYKSKSNAQEAHEAIRPTNVEMTPKEAAKYLDERQLKLYTLIWNRFVACQMAPAKLAQTSVEVGTNGNDSNLYTFRITATVTVFPGFSKIYKADDAEDDVKELNEVLNSLNEGDKCELKALNNEQKFTEPPPRYSEASLIRELESNGIGRPSTYASIVNTIQNREYVDKEKGRLIPTELGFKVNDYLILSLPDLFQIGFTANMEESLDKIEEGSLQWQQMLKDFYGPFEEWLEQAKDVGAPKPQYVENILPVLKKITKFAEPQKVGRRTYDDSKFLSSIEEKFIKDNKISEKQWETLLRLAITYYSQIGKEVEDYLAQNVDIKAKYAEVLEKVKIQQEKIAASTASDDLKKAYEKVFADFVNVEWNEPEVRRGRTYDDKKFFTSLQAQAERGKVLSERQLAALGAIAVKYKETIPNFEAVMEFLNVSSEDSGGQADPEIAKLIEKFKNFTGWAEPQKKGKRVFDEKSFYESLATQFSAKGNLTPRQVGALKRMDKKYFAPKEN
ncbi:type I DNA topoisomerase [Lentisphaerota bacterium WC36G]|nr:type I DNA topoisomerase [Lentisphaerae bacterium WC36]